ncbi:hypothetical protein OEA_13135 [Priestia megaterium NCT-2]|uniref:hypothetical protein n=1 Tax=Priestia megaterium TaxID=1404 RepID=UPI000EB688ED|nr:hypothetical protein [Priestia megaterium]AYE50683.1 hypothetical protein OEA_13135 [Priestia megaterium NCT-2]
MQLTDILSKLALKRPVFHSEADFQHALAWEIQNSFPNYDIRLEYNPQVFESRTYLDIWIRTNTGDNIAIELKYKTKNTKIKIKEETFNLQNHGAPANNRFLTVKDIYRLEHVINRIHRTTGYVIFLTNNKEYWQGWKEKNTKDKAFRLHEGRILTGTLKWGDRTATRTVNKLGDSLTLRGKYILEWKDYVKINEINHGFFKFLIVKV